MSIRYDETVTRENNSFLFWFHNDVLNIRLNIPLSLCNIDFLYTAEKIIKPKINVTSVTFLQCVHGLFHLEHMILVHLTSQLCPAVETLSVPPAETQSSSIWLIIGVVVPVLLAVFIIIILYWKLCSSEKLEFQPDAINTIQQRQKVRGQQEVVSCFLYFLRTAC